jgi:hypothetical protein
VLRAGLPGWNWTEVVRFPFAPPRFEFEERLDAAPAGALYRVARRGP